ncbi:MAG: EamA family transporter [Chloroflexi bacterium]|nr:EamA family transporter [Chloroflexota bacterium]
MFYTAIALTVVSNVIYHIFQKLTPGQVNPMLALTVAYLVAAVISLLLLPFFPLQTGLLAELRQVNWASVGLGASIVGLELGFLLAYRLGWNISLAALISNVAVALLLIPVGLLLFKEHITPLNATGLVVCLIGLLLVNWK